MVSAQPTLPTSSEDADAAVRASRYVELNDSVFYIAVLLTPARTVPLLCSPAANNWTYCKVLPRCTSTPRSKWYPSALHGVRSIRRSCVSSRLRDHVAQDACRHCTLKSSTSSATSCLSLLRPAPGLTSRKRLCPHSRKYHSVRLLVPLRTGVDEACEQRRPEEGLHTWR